MATLTLEGFLGKDRTILETRERTYTATSWNEVAEQAEEYEATVPSREFARLSLASHHWEAGRRVTRWHQLVVWNVEDGRFRNVLLARKGDRVRVTGRVEQRRFIGRDGVERTARQVVVESFHLVRIKPRRRVA
jgi:single-stranded DNA-binding protein